MDCQPHPLTISRRDHDGMAYEIDCPGVTESCRMWEECQVKDCPVVNDTDSPWDEDDMRAHGLEHKYIEGYSTPTPHCYLQVADELVEAIGDILTERGGVEPGRYLITSWSYDSGMVVDVNLETV